jgi:hypothetical protein
MGKNGPGHRMISVAWVMACVGFMSQALQAQNTTIGVGQPGPVVKQKGLLGTYYNYAPTVTATFPPPGRLPGSPDPSPAAEPSAVQYLQRLDGPINFDFNAPIPPGTQTDPGNAALSFHFMTAWTGFLNITTAANYVFTVDSDDGESGWFGDVTLTTPDTDFWNQRGTATDTSPTKALVVGRIPVRVEYEQGYGGAICNVYWSINGAARVLIPLANMEPPDGPDAPGGLTAVGSTNSATPQVTVNWNTSTTPVAATSYILSRATTSGGPYTQVAVQPGTNFVDTTVAFGTTYYYIVQGTAASGLEVGPPSAESPGTTPVKPAITVSPGGPITTSESGLNATLTLTVNIMPTAPATVTITSSTPSQALVSGQGNGDATLQGPAGTITIHINNATPVGTSFTINVLGQDDFVVNGNQPYTISFTVAGGGYAAPSIPTINGTNLEGDVLGIVATPSGGLTTTSAGGQATFTVALSSQPTATTTVSVASSNTTEGTVSPATLTFTTTRGQPYDPATGIGGWNVAHVVTVTGQGVNLTYMTEYYTVNLTVTGGDPAYIALTNPNPMQVSVANLHLETPPGLPHVWNGSGSGGGGCGLLGLEAGLVMGLAALMRRRRNS